MTENDSSSERADMRADRLTNSTTTVLSLELGEGGEALCFFFGGYRLPVHCASTRFIHPPYVLFQSPDRTIR